MSTPICSKCADSRKVAVEEQPGVWVSAPCPDCPASLPPAPWPWGDVQRRLAARIAAGLLDEAANGRPGRDNAETHLALDAARIALDLSERRR